MTHPPRTVLLIKYTQIHILRPILKLTTLLIKKSMFSNHNKVLSFLLTFATSNLSSIIFFEELTLLNKVKRRRTFITLNKIPYKESLSQRKHDNFLQSHLTFNCKPTSHSVILVALSFYSRKHFNVLFFRWRLQTSEQCSIDLIT